MIYKWLVGVFVFSEHISDIINLAFEYIAMLNKEGVQEWIFDEMKERNAIKFRFKGNKLECFFYNCQHIALYYKANISFF